MTRETLQAVLIPIGIEMLLLPSVAVAQAGTTQGLRPPVGPGPIWFAGWMSWSGTEIPVLRIDRLLGVEDELNPARARLVVVTPMTPALSSLPWALLSSDLAQLVTVSEATMTALPLTQADDPALVLGRAVADGIKALIPDLAEIERRVADLVEAADTGELLIS